MRFYDYVLLDINMWCDILDYYYCAVLMQTMLLIISTDYKYVAVSGNYDNIYYTYWCGYLFVLKLIKKVVQYLYIGKKSVVDNRKNLF